MSVRLDGEVVRLEGACWVEDAEPLARLLADGARVVDLDGCTHMHGAVLQALLAFGPHVQGEPEGAFLRRHLLPAVAESGPNHPGGTTNHRARVKTAGFERPSRSRSSE